jgi:hypothetical protein
MKNFMIIEDLPIYDLYTELTNLLNSGKIQWSEISNDQICINTTADNPDDFLLGRGSLIWDWDNSYTENGKLIVSKRSKILTEEEFTIISTPFKNTKFELVYNSLAEKYHLGRVRIMNSKPKTCLTWHIDTSPRIHYPIKTQEGCLMVIDNEVQHLSENTWWSTNTLESHTAFNGSKEERMHLVAVILGEK